MHWFDGLILAGAERWRRIILSHSGGRLAAARRAPDRLDALSRIVSFDDVPVARRRMMCGQPEQGFERNVPVEAAIIAKDEFIEIGVDVRAAQAMIRAQAPSLHQ
jgi:hypothetical protein